jgi:hypothetical protein
VIKVSLSIIQVLLSCDHISIEGWSKVVVDILGWVLPLCFRGGSSELEVMSNHAFGKLDGVEVVIDIVISTEVWYGIINIISQTLLFVLVLSASS